MIVRAIDAEGDWMFGKGRNDYKSGKAAIAQSIATRLRMFLGDCFFATDQGIDWFNLLGGKNRLAIDLAVSATILNTENVVSLVQLSIDLDANRHLTIVYSVMTNVGLVEATISQATHFLLTEGGDIFVTEDGEGLTTQ